MSSLAVGKVSSLVVGKVSSLAVGKVSSLAVGKVSSLAVGKVLSLPVGTNLVHIHDYKMVLMTKNWGSGSWANIDGTRKVREKQTGITKNG